VRNVNLDSPEKMLDPVLLEDVYHANVTITELDVIRKLVFVNAKITLPDETVSSVRKDTMAILPEERKTIVNHVHVSSLTNVSSSARVSNVRTVLKAILEIIARNALMDISVIQKGNSEHQPNANVVIATVMWTLTLLEIAMV